MMFKIFTICSLLFTTQANTWSGYDPESGSFVEIETEDLEKGETVDYYDSNKGYGQLTIDSIDDDEIEGTDVNTGKTRTFDMN